MSEVARLKRAPARLQHPTRNAAGPYLTAESGDLNTLVHLWAFNDAGDRAERRAAMAKDPAWSVYVKANADNGYIVDQRTSLMVPARFAPIKR